MQGYRYLGILSILLAWIAIGLVLYKWPIVKSKSISKHIAAQKESYVLNAIMTTPALLVFYIFMVKWFMPTYSLPVGFKVILTLGVALEVISALIPDTRGIKHRIHHNAAYAAAVLFPILIGFVVVSNQATNVTVIVSTLAILLMATTFPLFLFMKSARKQHLFYQSIYIASFHIAILAAIVSVKS